MCAFATRGRSEEDVIGACMHVCLERFFVRVLLVGSLGLIGGGVGEMMR